MPDNANERSISLHPNEGPRRQLARELQGDGIEFGPGCHPLWNSPLVKSIRYCDRFDRETYLRLFPEQAEQIAGFPAKIDYRCDFETEDFVEAIGPSSVDFVIASHVIEHLMNPLLFLQRVHRILRPSGSFYLAIPDKRSSFDRDRRRTTLLDLIDRYRRGECDLTDEAITKFLNEAEQPPTPITPEMPGYADRIAKCRLRSIHINVWIADDVLEILDYLGRSLDAPFELIDGLATGTETILILRKSFDSAVLDRSSYSLDRIWLDSYRHTLHAEWQPRFDELERVMLDIHRRLMVLDERSERNAEFRSTDQVGPRPCSSLGEMVAMVHSATQRQMIGRDRHVYGQITEHNRPPRRLPH